MKTSLNFIFAITIYFFVCGCNNTQKESSRQNADNVPLLDIDSAQNYTNVKQDSIKITTVLKTLLKEHTIGDFDDIVIKTKVDSESYIYSGIDMVLCDESIKKLAESNIFSEDFLANYRNIALYIDKELKKSPEEGYENEYPPYPFRNYDALYNAQDTPDDVNNIKIEEFVTDGKLATLKWTYPQWADFDGYSVKLKKENNVWKVSYLECYDIKYFEK
jgi:hypothetical protein